MFKQRLTSALEDALDNYNEGNSDIDSVVKSASDNDFNPDQTRRLVETFNTAKSLHHYKSAEDRSAHFAIVDPADAIHALFSPEASAKAASSKVASHAKLADGTHVSFYDNAPLTHTAKVAGVLDTITVTEYDQPTADDIATDIHSKVANYERSSEHAQADADIHMGRYNIDMPKLASHLDSDVYYSTRPEVMMGIAMKYGEAGADLVNDLTTHMIHKVSSEDLGDVPRVNMAPSKFATLFGRVDKLVNSVQQYEQHMAVKAAYDNAASKLLDVTGLRGAAKEELDKQAEEARTRFTVPSAISTARGAVGSVQGAVGSGVDALKESFPPKKDRGPSAKAERGQLVLDNLRRKLLLQNLLNTDDIIGGGDPELIRGAYQTFTDIAPEQSMNSEVVRSVLRQAVNSPGGVSPFDAKALADIQATINKGQV